MREEISGYESVPIKIILNLFDHVTRTSRFEREFAKANDTNFEEEF